MLFFLIIFSTSSFQSLLGRGESICGLYFPILYSCQISSDTGLCDLAGFDIECYDEVADNSLYIYRRLFNTLTFLSDQLAEMDWGTFWVLWDVCFIWDWKSFFKLPTLAFKFDDFEWPSLYIWKSHYWTRILRNSSNERFCIWAQISDPVKPK